MTYIKTPANFVDVGGTGLRTEAPVRPSTPADTLPGVASLAALWRGDAGVALSGDNVTSWTDSVNSLVLPAVGTPTVVASPGGTDAIDIGASDGFNKSDGIGDLPGGASPRTVQFVFFSDDATPSWGGFAYGAAAEFQSFGLVMRGDTGNISVDWFGDRLDGGQSAVDGTWRVYTATYDGNIASLWVGKTLVAQDDIQLNTGTTAINVLRSFSGNTTEALVGAIGVWDRVLTPLEIAQGVDYWVDLFVSDTVAPIVSNVAFDPTSPTAGTVSFDVTEGGFGWVVLSDSATPPSISQIKQGFDSAGAAGAYSVAALSIVGSGTYTANAVGLDPSTTYYPYAYCEDQVALNSGVVSGTSGATSAPDTTAPVLSAQTMTVNGSTGATGAVTTANDANGILYSVWTLSATKPTKSQVKQGVDHNQVARVKATQTITSTGAKTVSASTLSPETTYYRHDMHEDAAGLQSDVVTSGPITTAVAPTGTVVSNFSELNSALGSASPGDLILLNNGSYSGTLTGHSFVGGQVTVRAITPLAATAAPLGVNNCDNIRFEGMEFSGAYFAGCTYSENITFFRCKGRNGTYFGNPGSSGILWEECEFFGTYFTHDGRTGANAQDGQTYRTCLFRKDPASSNPAQADDMFRIYGNVTNTTVENCTFWDLQTEELPGNPDYVHGDFLQCGNAFGGTPKGIIIRGNHFVDLSATATWPTYRPQGIFISDSNAYEGVVIEQNLFSLGAGGNTCAIAGTGGAGINCFIQDNSVLRRDDGAIGAIATGSTQAKGFNAPSLLIRRNVAGLVGNASASWASPTATLTDNYTYDGAGMTSLVDWSTLGHNPADFRPFVGSPVETGYGALQRLADLQAGARYYHVTNGLQDGA